MVMVGQESDLGLNCLTKVSDDKSRCFFVVTSALRVNDTLISGYSTIL